MVSECEYEDVESLFLDVLILVVMEDGLRAGDTEKLKDLATKVLILVVMEDGLRGSNGL